MTQKISVVLCIDVEPDERLIPTVAQKSWPGFEATVEFFNDQRSLLEAATRAPVHYSWFLRMDPQIARVYGSAAWVAKRYSSIIESVKQAGDAIGLHVHPWRWDEKQSQWVADFGDQRWVNQCVQIGFESFYEALGERCQCFRFGDHWMNDATVETLDRLGTRFDLTLEPGQKNGYVGETFTGSFSDYSGVPQRPYQPAATDFREPGTSTKRELWMIPLSSGSIDQEYITLNLYFDWPTLCELIDRLLNGPDTSYLALVARTDIATNPEWYTNLRRTIDYLLRHPLVGELAFETPAEMMARMKWRQTHAHRNDRLANHEP